MKNPSITIEDVDPRAFEILISFMSGEVVKFKTVPTALAVIYAANKYMVNNIDILALKFVSRNITSDNVLLVLHNLYRLNIVPGGSQTRPTSQSDKCYQRQNLDKLCAIVIKRCFEVIDRNAKQILSSRQIEDISLQLLKSIIRRDTLCISSELVVWRAVHRWSHIQCRKRRLDPSHVNKRKVLEGAQYHIRFLTMTQEEFKEGQALTGLLSKEEEMKILDRRSVNSKDGHGHQIMVQKHRCGNKLLENKIRKVKEWKEKISTMKKSEKGKMTLIEELFAYFVCILC
eukprot:TRINITY_DN67147_c0_g1_i1.p1 TRINITY_DN67147_c0_g1~~TRINITY_DN67147_c0_g1_i1.p1  ORF type:complete len:287 (-),score=63.35 TRINITY_DN67147_c0_g1_i1:368-1228(-)